MSIPVAVKLTSVKTGEEKIFGSLAQASEFLKRSKGYLRWKIYDEQTDIVKSQWKEEFILTFIGEGRRRDWKPKPRKKGPPREYYPITFQLCSECARAVGFCPWSAKLEPVPGWDAEPTRNLADGSASFHIKGCPLHIKDAPTVLGRKKQRKMLMEELEREIREGKREAKAGPAETAPACKRGDPRAVAQAMAEAAARASDKRERALC